LNCHQKIRPWISWISLNGLARLGSVKEITPEGRARREVKVNPPLKMGIAKGDGLEKNKAHPAADRAGAPPR
jgi:hypothetical protein